MKIEVRVFATLRQGRQKNQVLQLPENTTINQILQILDIKQDEVSILLLNGVNGDFNRKLKDKDILSIFPPVGGG